MKFSEDGILDSSIHHFVHPSAFALEHLFYVQSLGRFDVSDSYRVNRFNYSSYLMLVPMEGTLSCTLDGQTATVSPGSVLLLDCHILVNHSDTSGTGYGYGEFGLGYRVHRRRNYRGAELDVAREIR